jgi:hypothetical protein
MARKPRQEFSVRDSLATGFIQQLEADWRENGPEAIAAMRRESPTKYCEVVARLVPQETAAKDPFADAQSMQDIGKRLLLQVGANEFALTPSMIEQAIVANDKLIEELCRIAGEAIQ